MSTTGGKRLRVRLRPDHLPGEERNLAPMQGQQPLPVQPKKPWSKKQYLLICILLFLFLAGSVFSALGYQTFDTRYHTDLSLAKTGVQHLQKAEALLTTWLKKPLDAQFTNQAKQEFSSVLKTFATLNNDLQASPAFATRLSVLGTRLSSALRLVPLAVTLSQAGVASSDISNTFVTGLHDPLASQGRGITLSNLAIVARDVKELSSALTLATREVNQLQPADMQFDPRITKLVDAFHKNLPMIQQWLNSVEQLLPVAPTLLGIGTPANYLFEMLDSTELRPGGGLIGNYGVASFVNGRFASTHITDVDLLDKPFEAAGHVIPYPPAYSWFNLAASWRLSNSDLDADFPTAARYSEQNYRKEGGGVPVQGVIAITPALFEHALAITGPIAIPEYHETITPQNLIARIHYHQLGPAGEGSDRIPSPDGHSSLRKRFTELLAEHFLARIRQLPSSNLPILLQLMANALPSKDLQLYFNSPIAESGLHRFQLDAVIRAPVGDSLFVVDANISENKANSFITNTLDDQVTIDSQGNAIHYATMRYAWTTAGAVYGGSTYKDFIHVYAPPGSVLLTQSGWQPRGTSTAFHRQVWMGYFTLHYGQTGTISLVWEVPAAASKDRGGWHYRYMLQRQAGAVWKLNQQVTLPSCAATPETWEGLKPNGRREATLAKFLTEDLNLAVDYTYK